MEKSGSLWQKFMRKCSEKEDFPLIEWNSIQEGSKEGLSVSYAAGKISATAFSLPSAIYGLNRLRMAIASGHLSETLGEIVPRFSLRPLWLGSDLRVLLNSLESACPFYVMDLQKMDKICERVVELGYNALVFGRREGMGLVSSEGVKVDWDIISNFLHEYGLKLILKASISDQISEMHSPANPNYCDIVKKNLRDFFNTYKGIDYFFWESELLHPHFSQYKEAEEYTLQELVVKELHMIEEILEGEKVLIFYVPSPDIASAKMQASWLSALCDEARGKTIIAFSAVAGDPTQDHAMLHPFWDKLRKDIFHSSTLLLPIVNVGGVRQGEGLWPALSFDRIDHLLSRSSRHAAGAISLVNFLPEKGGMLDCSLWAASSILWDNHNALQGAETWFAAFRPEWNFCLFSEDFKSIRQIIVQLSLLKSLTSEPGRDAISGEEGKALSESLLAQLKELEVKWEKEKKPNKEESSTLHDYYLYFARDARRIILYFLQCFNISIPNVLNQEDLQESFWTQFSQSGGQGMRSGKISFLEQPNSGLPGTRMFRIFAENHLIKDI